MTKRFIALGLLVTALVSLVLYSKWKPDAVIVSGMIEADEIRVGSRVGGRVAKVNVVEGEQVEAGVVLVELEPFDLLERERELERVLAAAQSDYDRTLAGFREEERAQAKARLDQLQARLELLKAGPRLEEIEAARARLEQAEAERRRARQDYERLSQLAEANATSQQELDTAVQAMDAALAMATVRQKELDVLQLGTREEELREAAARVDEAYQGWQLMQHGYRREDIRQAEATRDAAQARLEAIRKQMDELKIISPVAGTIEALDLQPGDMVAASAPVLSMLDRGRLWVRTYIPQTVSEVHVGNRVPVTIDSYPGEVFDGVISFVARQAEFTPSNIQTPEERSKLVYRVNIDVEDRENRLRPGMLADVWLDQIAPQP